MRSQSNKKIKFRKVAIIGVGLIGGSIGLALRRKREIPEVVGFFRKKRSARFAKKLKIVDKVTFSLKQAVCDADLVILATPIEIIKRISPKIINLMEPGAILMDVGSTKKEIQNSIESISLKKDISFVGAHPLAGSEKKGLKFSQANMFDKSICFLTPTKRLKASVLVQIKRFWQCLGSKVVVIDPLTHDRIVAFVSHLPHMVSFALMNTLSDNYLNFSGRGFRDCTRLASSDSKIWRDICLSNRGEILSALRRLKKSLSHLEILINRKEARKLEQYFLRAKNRRGEL